jgi:hypothetical protein
MQELQNRMQQLKRYRPFMIVYGYIDLDNEIYANYAETMRKPNNAAKKGFTVYIAK